MRLPKYGEYRDSGFDGLGSVPMHWSVNPLKRYATVQTGVAKGKDNEGKDTLAVPYLRVANVQDGYLKLDDVAEIDIPADSLARYRLQSGDVLMNEGGDADKLGRGCIWLGEIADCIHQNHVFAVRPHGISSEWLNWLTGSAYAQHYFLTRSKQSTNLASISSTNIMELPLLVPSPAEQSAIATFLDHETAKIDGLIAAQERLIALLAEKRQATISHAVTRGLNPQVPMKDSGVPWLGEVPAHWGIKSIGYVLDSIADIDHYMPASVDKGVPYLMTGDLTDFASQVKFDACKQVSQSDYLVLSKRVKNSHGDVIMARYATIGTLMYVDIDEDFLVSYACVTLKPNSSKISGQYLFQCMKSDAFHQGVEHQINTNTQGNVGIKDLKNVKVALPPLDEQASIVEFLHIKISKFNVLRAEAERAIGLLKERRSALIAAAVTGQIDVRGFSSPSPVASEALKS